MEMLTVPDVAELLAVPVTEVRSRVKDGTFLSVRRDDGVLVLPAEQFDGTELVKHFSGVLTLLRDAGYNDDEALRWLTTADDTLPGTPLQALHENRATEIKRRAQALAF
ncbi:MAG: Rv2175c family DNA-binding protein [Mycobacteriales bacterium]|nr:Rv2175c family DNA-binding protein [Mycobacteriales bacterium]